MNEIINEVPANVKRLFVISKFSDYFETFKNKVVSLFKHILLKQELYLQLSSHVAFNRLAWIAE
jgi:hypothetical protein